MSERLHPSPLAASGLLRRLLGICGYVLLVVVEVGLHQLEESRGHQMERHGRRELREACRPVSRRVIRRIVGGRSLGLRRNAYTLRGGSW